VTPPEASFLAAWASLIAIFGRFFCAWSPTRWGGAPAGAAGCRSFNLYRRASQRRRQTRAADGARWQAAVLRNQGEFADRQGARIAHSAAAAPQHRRHKTVNRAPSLSGNGIWQAALGQRLWQLVQRPVPRGAARGSQRARAAQAGSTALRRSWRHRTSIENALNINGVILVRRPQGSSYFYEKSIPYERGGTLFSSQLLARFRNECPTERVLKQLPTRDFQIIGLSGRRTCVVAIVRSSRRHRPGWAAFECPLFEIVRSTYTRPEFYRT
jgi:hypothetical protein